MSIFVCCEREDETKYFHTCECPSATFSCESETINPTLCGFSEFSGNGISPSTPPKKYRQKDINWSQYDFSFYSCCFDGSSYSTKLSTSLSLSNGFVSSTTYSSSDCSIQTSNGSPCPNGEWTGSSRSPDPCESEFGNISGCCSDSGLISTINSTTSITQASSYSINHSGACSPSLKERLDKSKSTVLSVQDTESDAIARETPVSGTFCTSTWQTRSNGFSFIKQTSGYTIDCDRLVVGLEYEVKPAIRKRTAVIGSFGEWEDVTVTPVTFTATATTKTIDDGGDPIELDHVQGYEYQITGVNIEKKA